MAGSTYVTWTSIDMASIEECAISDLPGPKSIVGSAALPYNGIPAQLTYHVDTAADWTTSLVDIEVRTAAKVHRIVVRRVGDDWSIDGVDRQDLARCTNIDLGWSPATNTLALRHHRLNVGERTIAHSAWLRFPQLDVVASEQTYTRLSADSVRYESATFAADLVLDANDVVLQYGDDLWVAPTTRREQS